jgi:hypothetical protein
MYKGLAVLAVSAFVLLSPAQADVLNVQSVDFGAGNTVLTAGDGGGGNTNLLTVGTSQLATSPGHVTAYQDTAGSLIQAAGANGGGGAIGVVQSGGGLIWQVLGQPSGTSMGFQDQDMVVVLDQEVIDAGGGAGSAVGIQNFVGIQTQLTFTMWGASANIQAIGVTLFDGVGGGPGGVAIGGTAQIGVGQDSTP